eukprot:6208694-Pleurochrysis_carterae.AAC.1
MYSGDMVITQRMYSHPSTSFWTRLKCSSNTNVKYPRPKARRQSRKALNGVSSARRRFGEHLGDSQIVQLKLMDTRIGWSGFGDAEERARDDDASESARKSREERIKSIRGARPAQAKR